MNISAKEAYELVKKEAEGFLITGCLELSDRYLFGWCQTDGTAIMLPPICVFKKQEKLLSMMKGESLS